MRVSVFAPAAGRQHPEQADQSDEDQRPDPVEVTVAGVVHGKCEHVCIPFVVEPGPRQEGGSADGDPEAVVGRC